MVAAKKSKVDLITTSSTNLFTNVWCNLIISYMLLVGKINIIKVHNSGQL